MVSMIPIVAIVFTVFSSSQAVLEEVIDASHRNTTALKAIGHVEPSNSFCNISLIVNHKYVRSELWSNASCGTTHVSVKEKLTRLVFTQTNYFYRFVSKAPALTILTLR